MLDRSDRRIYSRTSARSTLAGEMALASARSLQNSVLLIGICLFWGFILFFALATYLG